MKKIMVVDDEPMIIRLVTKMLTPQYEVVGASSGKQAIELFEKEAPNMVLSDLIMPEMTGYDLLKRLKELYHTEVPFMFMTGDDDRSSESLGFELGASDYIKKPFKGDVLLRRVEKILKNENRMEELQRISSTDPMTGLLNKTSVQDQIEALLEKFPGILMVIDIDSFKLINDMYGHSMGDRILLRFTEILKQTVRSMDIVGRVGGDEFVVFCPRAREENVVADKAAYTNEKLLEAARDLMGENMTIPLGISIGAALAPDEGTSYEVLFTKADKALYKVKQNGKHGYSIYRGSDHTAVKTKEPRNSFEDLKQVLEERNFIAHAYDASEESFRAIYRFLRRQSGKIPSRIVMLTMIPPASSAETDLTLDDASYEFRELLKSRLEFKNVINQTGSLQYAVIMPFCTEEEARAAVFRLLVNWKDTIYGKKYEIRYEESEI